MSKPIPYGKAESAKLEFKGRDSRLVDVAREVAAFLNARGGEVWWGVGEAEGKAAAPEPFQDAEAQKRDLQNHLIDTLEPSPEIPGEVDIESVLAGGAGCVIQIRVKKPGSGRTPFAQLKDQGRRYWLRVGDRVRIMTREEIRKAFAQGTEEGQEIEKRLLVERERVQKARRPCFWMEIHPVPELNHQDFDVGDDGLKELLRNPTLTGNRRNGWTFVRELDWPKLGPRGLRQGNDVESVEINKNGAIAFSAALEQLHWKGDEREIWPYALLEYSVSLMRLAAKVSEKWGGGVTELLVDFALVGLRGWTLRAGSPAMPIRRYGEPEPFPEDGLVPVRPFRFEKDELVAEADRCGLRLITEIYQAFGYGREAIPPEFDRKTGILTLPG